MKMFSLAYQVSIYFNARPNAVYIKWYSVFAWVAMGRSSVHLSDSKRSWNNCCIAEWRRVALIPVWYTPNVIPQRLLFPRNTNARTDAIKYWVWIKNHLADGTTEEENAVFLELEAIASKRQSVLSYRLVLALHKLQYDRCWAHFGHTKIVWCHSFVIRYRYRHTEILLAFIR